MSRNWGDNKICEQLFGTVKGLEELYDQQKHSKGHLPLLFGKVIFSFYVLKSCFPPHDLYCVIFIALKADTVELHVTSVMPLLTLQWSFAL